MVDVSQHSLVSLQTVAERLDVSVQVVRKWARTGSLETYKVGPHLVRTTWDAVQSFLLANSPSSAPEPKRPNRAAEAHRLIMEQHR